MQLIFFKLRKEGNGRIRDLLWHHDYPCIVKHAASHINEMSRRRFIPVAAFSINDFTTQRSSNVRFKNVILEERISRFNFSSKDMDPLSASRTINSLGRRYIYSRGFFVHRG